ncbi:garp complex component [Moniliophthora roreri MCA 2997]|uniref:Garp complex component n=2 Tax=Moniliophthora roreri TaxID=221103 RepID=V2WXF9_MONRO|nr:garp complex component [Moniliophthora roreri MCA 2997]
MSESSPPTSRPSTPTPLPDTARPGYAYRFNYGKGPESVSGTTTDGNYVTAGNNPPLNLHFSSSTTNLTLPSEWSSATHGFHAISTVLNNPHKKQAPPKAHSGLPSVPPAELPRVRRKDFEGYLKAVDPEWRRFAERAQHTEQEEQEAGPSTLPLGSSLDTVPEVFFQSNFDLGDPNTFSAVTENEDDADPLSLSHSLPLLEKFSHYLDTVELHLTHEIRLRSSSFFAALTNLHSLQAESTTCLAQITRLRGMLEEVDKDVAKKGLEVIRVEQKARNVEKVEEGLRGVLDIVGMSTKARDMVGSGRWNEALNIVTELEGRWEGKQRGKAPERRNGMIPRQTNATSSLSPMPEEDEDSTIRLSRTALKVPLSSLTAFSALPSHLQSLSMEIASKLSGELVTVLREDLADFITYRQREKEKTRNTERVKERISPLLNGLVRTKGLKEATLSWREVVSEEMKAVVTRRFPVDADVKDDSTFAKSLHQAEFLSSLKSIYIDLLSAIEGLQQQTLVVGEVMESLQRLNGIDPSHTSTLQTDFTDNIHTSTELSHSTLSTILTSRQSIHTSLPLPEFFALFRLTWDFVVQSEVLCRKMIVGLRGCITGQARSWLQSMHQERLEKSAKGVEDEVWGPVEVEVSEKGGVQQVVGWIVDSAVKDVGGLVVEDGEGGEPSHQPTEVEAPPNPIDTPPTATATTTSIPTTTASTSTKSKYLKVESHPFHTVACTNQALLLLLDYLKIPVNIPGRILTTDVMSRVMEFMKAFNSRTCQVVLGAGALRSAGLKNITAKHLALASQSLSIMIALIPYIREMFRRHLSPKQAIMLVEFDKLKRDYQEHQNEIHAKLIAIMGDRLSAHIKTFQAIDWNVPKSGGGVNDYMELLVKETVTLHKVLSRYLSSTVVEDVMSQVFAAINHRLSEEYSKFELPHAEAKMRLLADAKYLHSRLSGLKNVGGLSNMLEIVIQEKRLTQAQAKNAPPTPTRSATSPPPMATVNSTSTSQRLKGLLSGRSTSSSFEKPQPPPPPQQATPTPPTSRPQTPQRQSLDASPPLPGKDVANGVITGTVNGTGASTTAKINGDTSPLPPLPPEASADGDRSGFRQVEASQLEAENSQPRSDPERRGSQETPENQNHVTSSPVPARETA